MADGTNNNSNNDAYRRMLEKSLGNRSLDELLGENKERPSAQETSQDEYDKINGLIDISIKTDVIDKLVYRPLKTAEKVLPELPSEFERTLLFSGQFDDWKPYGKGAIVRINNVLYACFGKEEKNQIYTGIFQSYFGYGQGALVMSNEYRYGDFSLFDDSPIYLCAPKIKQKIFFPNHWVNPWGCTVSSWATYSTGVMHLLSGGWSNGLLVARSDSGESIKIAKLRGIDPDTAKLHPAAAGVIVQSDNTFTIYPAEKNAEGVRLYLGGWSRYAIFSDDLIVQLGSDFVQYSAGKDGKLIHRGEEKDWKMTGCGLLVGREDGQINLGTDDGKSFLFKGNFDKIQGYPLGMLVEDESQRLWAIRRKRD